MASEPKTDPYFITLPDVTVATVHSSGAPSDAAPEVIKALYGAVYGLKSALKKQGIEMKPGTVRARWDLTSVQEPAGQLEGDWAVPVPDGTVEADLPQKSDAYHVSVARWTYGECARILHLGAYDAEEPTVAKLVSFIDEGGYEIAGMHEEWYLSRPSAKVPKTVILYPVRKKA